MKYSDLLLNSARQAMTNKISWLYIFAALIGQITVPLSKSIPLIKYISPEIWFLSTVLSMIFISSLVYSVSQKVLNNLDTSVFDGWRKGLSKIIQVGFLNILLLVVLFVFLALVGMLLKKSIPYGLLRTIVLAIFLRPILNFGICAIVINNRSIGASIKTSVLMFIKNAWQTLIISGILIVIQQVLLDIIVLIFMSPYRNMLFTSLFKMLELPQVMFWDQVLALILSPWIVIIFTHLYLRFINDSEHTVLSPSREST